VRLITYPIKTAISEKRLSISVQNFLGLFVGDVCITSENFIKILLTCVELAKPGGCNGAGCFEVKI